MTAQEVHTGRHLLRGHSHSHHHHSTGSHNGSSTAAPFPRSAKIALSVVFGTVGVILFLLVVFVRLHIRGQKRSQIAAEVQHSAAVFISLCILVIHLSAFAATHMCTSALSHCKYHMLWQGQKQTNSGQENAALDASTGIDAKSSLAANRPAIGVNAQASVNGHAEYDSNQKIGQDFLPLESSGQQGLHTDHIAAGNPQQAWVVPGAPAYPDGSPYDSLRPYGHQSIAPAQWQTNTDHTQLLVTGTPLQYPGDHAETPAWTMQQPGAYKPTFAHQAGVDY